MHYGAFAQLARTVAGLEEVDMCGARLDKQQIDSLFAALDLDSGALRKLTIVRTVLFYVEPGLLARMSLSCSSEKPRRRTRSKGWKRLDDMNCSA